MLKLPPNAYGLLGLYIELHIFFKLYTFNILSFFLKKVFTWTKLGYLFYKLLPAIIFLAVSVYNSDNRLNDTTYKKSSDLRPGLYSQLVISCVALDHTLIQQQFSASSLWATKLSAVVSIQE